jgi:hypothetical protein
MIINELVRGSLTNILLAASAPSSHLLQIYEDDEQLLDRLEDFVYFGLERREACIVIATPAHRAELRTLLTDRGIDVEQAIDDGRFIDLDARETLHTFMKDGSPDPEKFEDAARSCIATARGNGRPVRAFGEMVALLWKEGNQEAAIKLEHLWNELIGTEDIALFCAYPAEAHTNDPLDLIDGVYTSHTALVL